MHTVRLYFYRRLDNSYKINDVDINRGIVGVVVIVGNFVL